MRRRASWAAAVALAVTLAPAAGAQDPVAQPRADPAIPQALARKVIEGYGGGAALSRVKAVRQAGRVVALAQGRKTGTLERLLALPDSLRVEIAYPGEPKEIRVHDAGKGFRDGHDVTGTIPHFAMILQSARLALPLWIAGGRQDLRYTGPVERESRKLETVAVTLPGGLDLTGEIDPASGRIVRTIGRIPGPGGEAIEFVNTYSDFRSVGGVAFAHREENFARGVHTGETVLEKIEVLAAAPPGAFAVPPAAPPTATPATRL